MIKIFKLLNNWENRYEYLIDLGKQLKPKHNKFRSEDKLIEGCQSNVWLEAKFSENKIFFDADSDAIIPKGIAAFMVTLYSGVFPIEIVLSNDDFFNEIQLDNFLSPIRSNGLLALFKRIKLYSIFFYKKNFHIL